MKLYFTSNLPTLACCVCTLASLTSAIANEPPAANPEEMYRPGVIPDRIILTWTGDPATTQAVTWRTSTDVPQGKAEIAVAGAEPDFMKDAVTVAATSQALLTDLSTAHFHTVRFKDLQPATKYAYRVGDGRNWSEWFHFTTASQDAAPLTFVYFGDAQNNLRSMWSRVIREAYGDAPDLDFFLHAGDLVNSAESDREWGEWFGAGAWVNGMVPSIAVPGNHEQASSGDGRRLSHHWRPSFAFPQNGPAGLEESCYTIVIQGVRIIALNSNQQMQDQTKWLEGVLEKNREKWVIVTFHHPIYSTGNGRDNASMRGQWKPLFDRFHVDLVLQGHDHTYGRTGLETPLVGPDGNELDEQNQPGGVNARDQKTGTVYVVSVSGPKMYTMQRFPFMPRQAEYTQLYQIIRVDGDELKYESRTAVGEVYDAFTLKKQKGRINQLIDQTPGTPERQKPAAMIAAEIKDKVTSYMKKYDKNEDGKVTLEELPNSEHAAFRIADADQNGELLPEELTKKLEARL